MKNAGAMLAVLLLGLTGCRFERHTSPEDKDQNVKFATPFGGLSVKTDEKSTQAGVGLTPYPGAVLSEREADGKDNNSANVNLSFGNFHVGVRALSYQSADAPDKVLAFYRKDMAKYGAVILCKDKTAIGQPTRTQEGLTCNGDSQGTTIHLSDGGQQELKAGSKMHQHVVSVEAKNGGTKIGLVALDLPGNLGGDDDAKE